MSISVSIVVKGIIYNVHTWNIKILKELYLWSITDIITIIIYKYKNK